MWVQKRNDLKQDARLLRHPQAFGVAKGLAPNKSSSTARDMTGLRAQLNHGVTVCQSSGNLSISVLNKTPI